MKLFIHFQTSKIQVWEWKIYFIPHFIMDVLTYPCWDLSDAILVKGALDDIINDRNCMFKYNDITWVSLYLKSLVFFKSFL